MDMNKNSEQNSKLPNTEENLEDSGITIEALAQPYKALVKFSYDELREEFDNYWKAHGALLAKQFRYKGRKVKGGGIDLKKAQKALETSQGVSKLYKSLLSETMGKMVEIEIEDKVMIATDAGLYNFTPGNETVMGVLLYFLWPKLVKDKDTLNFVQVDHYSDLTAEKQFAENQIPMLIDKHKEFVETEDTVITAKHRVSLDVITADEDGPNDSITFRSQWHELKNLPQPLADLIVGRSVGDLFEADWELGEKKLHSHIKIYAIMDVVRLDSEDPELFKRENFDSMEACFAEFKEGFDKRMKQGKKHVAFDDIMTQVLLGADIPSIPQVWITLNRGNFMQRHIDQFGGDKRRAMQAIGAIDEDDMFSKFEGQVFKETINQIAMNWYAETFNCLADAESISTDIENRVTWVSPEKEEV